MEQLDIGNIENFRKLDQFSKDELFTKFTTLENEYQRSNKEIYRLKYQNLTEEQLIIVLSEHLNELRFDMYGASSERYKKSSTEKKEERKARPSNKKAIAADGHS